MLKDSTFWSEGGKKWAKNFVLRLGHGRFARAFVLLLKMTRVGTRANQETVIRQLVAKMYYGVPPLSIANCILFECHSSRTPLLLHKRKKRPPKQSTNSQERLESFASEDFGHDDARTVDTCFVIASMTGRQIMPVSWDENCRYDFRED
jgi:hypothetical protein